MAMGSGIWCMRPILRLACESITTSSSQRTTQRGLSAFAPHAEGDEDEMINRLVFPFLRMLLGCMALLAVPVRVCAQDSTPTTADLVVTVRDVQGAPIPGLTVQIHAGADTPMLSETRTDAQGHAVFANISVSQVRVRVIGTLASGAHLYQIGADAPGVAVFLGPPPTTLDLRVDSDGMVLPDPVTMIDPLAYGP